MRRLEALCCKEAKLNEAFQRDSRSESWPTKRLMDVQLSAGYGTAIASEACSEGRTTQVFFRLRPLIAPVTFITWPSGQDEACTNTASKGASTKGSDFNTVWAEHGNAKTEDTTNTDAKTRIFMIQQTGEIIIADR
jgi:hypothetical protein